MKYLLILLVGIPINLIFCQKLYFNHSDRVNMSITESELNSSETFGDFHKLYRSSWVEEYIETRVTLVSSDETIIIEGKNDLINSDIRKLLSRAKVGDEIKLWIKYIPKNNLKENPIREMDYTYVVAPESTAQFMNGEYDLMDYLHENLTCKLTNDQYNTIETVRLKITISPAGEVINPILKTSTGDQVIDELIIKSFTDMPLWSAAKSISGAPVESTIRFIISNREQGCPEF